jgi:glutathione peroxidase
VIDLEVPRTALDGTPLDTGALRGRALLVVNVASRCGLTPQYAALEDLQRRYADRGFTVLGVPCNQFGGQEPGTAGDIEEFCQVNYGVTFPLTEKIEVNGPNRHALYRELTPVAATDGHSGDIRWNFEKFLVDPAGTPLARFGTPVEPLDPVVVEAVEKALPR